jgi:hypothetical protein
MHDGEYPVGFVDVGRIVRSHVQVRCVVVELPKPFLAMQVDRAEIVLMMRVIVGVESVVVPMSIWATIIRRAQR